MINYTIEILVAICVIFFLWGLGYLITSDMERQLEYGTKCIAAGMQNVEGNCIK